MILDVLDELTLEEAICFGFETFNNKVEYEVLIVELIQTIKMSE